ncbi:MAG: PAS domain S-box protein [Methanobacteriaceae archaeon]|nr:PAS domain S-box protein [Methanobacteriaceae archaeon]
MSHKKILLVEDESIEAMDIKKNLESYGFEVPYVASYGDEAIQKAREINPDLILMDIVLKGEVDGIDAAQKIMKLNIPVVYLTAHSEKATIERAKFTTPYGYILKPFQSNELALTIEMAIYKHEMEKNLRKNEEKFRLLYENAPLPYQSLNEAGILVDVNKTWLEKMGFTRGDVLGRHFTDFLSPASEKIFKKYFNRKYNYKCSNLELELVKKDGNIITAIFEGNISYDLEGNIKHINCIFQDISFRKNAEKKLEESEEKFRTLFESSPLSIIIHDKDTGEIIDANSKAIKSYGFSSLDELKNNDFWLDPPYSKDDALKWIHKTVEEGPQSFKWKNQKIDGEYFWEHVYLDSIKIKGQDMVMAISQDITPTEISYRKLKDNKKKLKGVLDASDDSIFLIDTKGRFIEVNNALARRFNSQPEKMIGANIKEFIPDKIYKNRWKYIKKAIATKRNVYFEDRRDDTYFAHNIYPITTNNKVTMLAIYSKDITIKKESEEKLKKSEDKYRRLVNNLQEGIWSIDQDGFTNYVNKPMADMLGYTVKEVMGKHLFDFMDSKGREKAVKYLERRKRGIKEQHDFEFLRKDGKRIYTTVITTPINDEHGNYAGALASVVDITKRIRDEKIRRQQYKFLQYIIDVIPSPIFYKDLDYTYLGCNQAFEEFIGISKDEIIGKNVFELLPPEQARKYHEKDRELLENPGKQEYEALVKYADGREHVVIINKATYNDLEGNLAGIIGVMTDITERKNFEDKLKSIIKEKDSLIREIHHRVKNNMQIISSLLSLQMEYVDDFKSYELFQESRNRVKSMAMIHEKLYMTDELSQIDMHKFIEGLIYELSSIYGANTQINKKISVDNIYIDISTAVPCAIILNELITNSIKHAFPHGRAGELEVSFKKVNDDIELIVSDNGVGFPEDMDFKKPKTLGLQLVNSIVNQINGRIELDKNNGSSIKITFKN